VAAKRTFTAVIKSAGGGGAYVDVPFDVEMTFGAKRPKIKAKIEGEPYRGTLVRMGGECHMLLILKSIRDRIARSVGDEVRVTVELDAEPRVVVVPDDLAGALKKDRSARTFFDTLSYTHRKEYAAWITDAKKDETRRARVIKAVEMLRAGQRER
jgi:hypothetical protein